GLGLYWSQHKSAINKLAVGAYKCTPLFCLSTSELRKRVFELDESTSELRERVFELDESTSELRERVFELDESTSELR
ncbi:MAG: hypothetical protein ACYT04_000000102230, partial [Nostoc sp.]